MNQPDASMERILRALQERAKELECLYRIDELLVHVDSPLEEVIGGVIRALPPGYQYPALCVARIRYGEIVHTSSPFVETPWVQAADIVVDGEAAGRIEIFYREQAPKADEGPFLKEERRLINTIAERLGRFIAHQRLRTAFHRLEDARLDPSGGGPRQWAIIVDFLKQTDRTLLDRITRKMLNHLCWLGIEAALALLNSVQAEIPDTRAETGDDNRHLGNIPAARDAEAADATFAVAEAALTDEQILTRVQKWIREDRARFFVTTVGNPNSTLEEVIDAIRRLDDLPPEEVEFPDATRKGLRVSLIEHFFTTQRGFISAAKRSIDIDSYREIVDRIICPPKSRGKLGGKSAGLFLAEQIVRQAGRENPLLRDVKIPRSWYITTDVLLDFIQHNQLEDVYNQKYADLDQVRHEYPNIVQTFRNSRFSPPIINGLSRVLDDLDGRPLIVRSSSLLEDRFGAAFSGKYKSLFIANQGTKEERLHALMDAIAEIYASTFAPDPIEYRAERGLIDEYEEMGILIQDVVGTRIGRYFLPSFSGVAFSRNDFRWSARIRREDGLLRLVPGLGTRAVDRLKDDYPILLAPGQPSLRVNVSLDEIIRYSPRKIDVIDLGTGGFATVDLREFLETVGAAVPQMGNMVSILEEDRVRRPIGPELDSNRDRLIFTFDGLVSETPFVRQIRALLECLEREIGAPVDIEFASDGNNLFLLQCRPQSASAVAATAPIPRDVSPDRILFSAKRFVSNGLAPNLTHIVYVHPENYAEIPTLEGLKSVGRAVGRLNKILPKRQFLLMGPGRWGSRGDIRLGVNVTYSDINNTAALVEIARKRGHYSPELSFGTHFFQDLVEAGIHYLPLYPDEGGIQFNEAFLMGSENVLSHLLPEFAPIAGVLRVIDVPRTTGGLVVRLVMNADADEAIAVLAPPPTVALEIPITAEPERPREENHWGWRLRFAERLAANLDPASFGVRAIYVFGSTKNATAGPASDIDLLIHFDGTESQRRDLEFWLDGWSRSLSEINYLRTGYRTEGLLDVHIVTDADIASRSSYAVKIGAVTDPARPLTLMNGPRAP
jgi:hypothetical protein